MSLVDHELAVVGLLAGDVVVTEFKTRLSDQRLARGPGSSLDHVGVGVVEGGGHALGVLQAAVGVAVADQAPLLEDLELVAQTHQLGEVVDRRDPGGSGARTVHALHGDRTVLGDRVGPEVLADRLGLIQAPGLQDVHVPAVLGRSLLVGEPLGLPQAFQQLLTGQRASAFILQDQLHVVGVRVGVDREATPLGVVRIVRATRAAVVVPTGLEPQDGVHEDALDPSLSTLQVTGVRVAVDHRCARLVSQKGAVLLADRVLIGLAPKLCPARLLLQGPGAGPLLLVHRKGSLQPPVRRGDVHEKPIVRQISAPDRRRPGLEADSVPSLALNPEEVRRDRSVTLDLGVAEAEDRRRLLHHQPAGGLDGAVGTNHVAHDAPLVLLGRRSRELDLSGEDAVPGHPVPIPALVVHRHGLPGVPLRVGLPGLGVEGALQPNVADLG